MSGSLSGVGVQQQIPAANTFKPGEQVRQREKQEPAESSTQASNVQETGASENVIETRQAESLKGGDDSGPEERRGSRIDLLI